eukprot:5973886-Pleurochrysis_carterae.AAC.1
MRAALLESFPEGGDVLNRIHKRHRLAGTGFTKITIALNNPTPIHTDHENIGLIALLYFDVSLEGEELIGGSHTINSPALSQAVVVRDSKDDTFLCGSYQSTLHGNLASLSGRRFNISAYTTDLTISASASAIFLPRHFRHQVTNTSTAAPSFAAAAPPSSRKGWETMPLFLFLSFPLLHRLTSIYFPSLPRLPSVASGASAAAPSSAVFRRRRPSSSSGGGPLPLSLFLYSAAAAPSLVRPLPPL